MQNVQMGLIYGLEPMAKVAAQYKQTKLSQDLDKQYEALYNRFNMFFTAGPQQ